jgi:hypothetical protein
MKNSLRFFVFILLMAFFTRTAYGQCPADNGGNSYSGNYNGANNGTGFDAFTVSPASNGSNNGAFIGNSNGNGDGGPSSIGSSCWALYANGGQTASAVRPFTSNPINVSSTLSLGMDNGFIDNGGSVGFDIRNSSGNVLLTFDFLGGNSNYRIDDNSGVANSTLGFTDDGLTFVFTRTATSTYSLAITRLAGGSQTINGTLKNPTGGQVPAQIRFFNINAGGGGQRDAYFNNLAISNPPASLTYSSNPATYCTGVAITNNSPTSNGGAVVSYSVSPSLPAGLMLNTGTGVISGTPTVASAAANYTVTATNACGSTNAAVNIATVANNWVGGSGNWNVPANWSCVSVPASNAVITISSGNPQIDVDVNVAGSLTLSGSGSLTILPNKDLSVASGGTANFNGQSVTVMSTSAGTGSIGKILGTLSGETNVTVERYIPSGTRRNYHLLSAPTSGQTIRQAWQEGDLNPNPRNNNKPGYGTQITGTASFFSGNLAAAEAAGFDTITATGVASLRLYNGTNFSGATTTNTAFATNGGYFLYIRGDRSQGALANTVPVTPTTLRSTGTMYKGAQTVSGIGNGSFGLIGNLYPSAINFKELVKSGIANTFWLWDANKGSGSGSYESFSAVNNFECNACGGSWNIDDIDTLIQSGQAFFVQGSGGSGSVELTENSKVKGSSTVGLRPLPGNSPTGTIVKINTRLYQRFNVNPADGNVVVFDAQYSNDIDADDALKLTTSAENIGMIRDGKVLVVEARQPVTSEDTITYYIWNLSQIVKEYRLVLTPSNLAQPGLTATLEDSYTGNKTPIDLSQPTITVNFEIDNNPASYAVERFRLVLKQGPPLPVRFVSIAANRAGNGVKVDWKVAEEIGIVSYEVQRSTDGRSFTSIGAVKALGTNGYTWTDASPLLGNSFYRIKSIGVNGEVKFTNIAKVFAGNIKPAIGVIPNPVEGKMMNLQFGNREKGRYDLRLLNVPGQVVYSGYLEHPGGNSSQMVELPSVVPAGAYQLMISSPTNKKEIIKVFVH